MNCAARTSRRWTTSWRGSRPATSCWSKATSARPTGRSKRGGWRPRTATPLSASDPNIVAIAADFAVEGESLPVFDLDDIKVDSRLHRARHRPRCLSNVTLTAEPPITRFRWFCSCFFPGKSGSIAPASGQKHRPTGPLRNDGRDHKERNIMRIALRIALAASAALLTLGVAQAQEKTLQDRHRRRLSALQQPDRRRQARRLRHRHRQGALRRDEGEVRLRHPGLGRHHPGTSGRQVRRHHRLDVDHAGAQGEGRLHQQILQHAAGDRRAEGLPTSRA